jgi:hypothetical protein
MWTRIIPIVGTLCLVAATLSAAEDPPLRAIVSPHYAASPATVRVQAMVTPDAENHGLIVVIDSAAYYRSSVIPLDGDRSSRVHLAEFRSVPAGAHVITVALLDRRGGTRVAVHDSIWIVN